MDVASLFSASPAGPSQDLRFRQGKVISFDPNTLSNVIDVGGTQLTNLPVLGVGEAVLLAPGAQVGVLVIGDEGQAKTYAILGQLVAPNTPAATAAVTLLNQQTFAQTITSLPAGENIPSTVYGDLTTVGPQVTVNVGPTGRVLANFNCQIQYAGAGAYFATGQVAMAMSGANSLVPSSNDPFTATENLQSATAGQRICMLSIQQTFEGLNPGVTTFTAKYRVTPSTNVTVTVFRRTLTVIKL